MFVIAPSRPRSAKAPVRRRPASAGAALPARRRLPTAQDADETQKGMTEAIMQEAAAVPPRPQTAGARRAAARPPSPAMRRATRRTPGWVDRLSRRGQIAAPPRPHKFQAAATGPTATRARIRALSRNKSQGGALPPHRMLPPLEMPEPPPKTIATHARLAMLAQKLDKDAHARNYFAQVCVSYCLQPVPCADAPICRGLVVAAQLDKERAEARKNTTVDHDRLRRLATPPPRGRAAKGDRSPVARSPTSPNGRRRRTEDVRPISGPRCCFRTCWPSCEQILLLTRRWLWCVHWLPTASCAQREEVQGATEISRVEGARVFTVRLDSETAAPEESTAEASAAPGPDSTTELPPGADTDSAAETEQPATDSAAEPTAKVEGEVTVEAEEPTGEDSAEPGPDPTAEPPAAAPEAGSEPAAAAEKPKGEDSPALGSEVTAEPPAAEADSEPAAAPELPAAELEQLPAAPEQPALEPAAEAAREPVIEAEGGPAAATAEEPTSEDSAAPGSEATPEPSAAGSEADTEPAAESAQPAAEPEQRVAESQQSVVESAVEPVAAPEQPAPELVAEAEKEPAVEAEGEPAAAAEEPTDEDCAVPGYEGTSEPSVAGPEQPTTDE